MNLEKTILVIDDNQDILDLYLLVLRLAGYNVFSASSGREGLNFLREMRSLKLSLILVDMNLGDMTGLEFIKEFEKDLPELASQVSIVFCSAMDECLNSRAVGWIKKPVDLSRMVQAVNRFAMTSS